ncbi:MAG: MIP/aquaporin family protein [Myxococcota bacterium]
MTPFLGELIGTALLLFIGNGVVANVVLSETKGHDAGWIVITVGWGLAVFVAVFTTASASGAHLNPAVTLGLAVAGKFGWAKVGSYLLAQFIGAALGSTLSWAQYRQHYDLTQDAATKRATFCTAPAIYSVPDNLFSEAIGTFVLVFCVLFISSAEIGLGALDALPVGFLVLVIGLGLGGTTGYAINPARDLSPRLMHAILPIPNKGHNDWSYAWIPVIGPFLGGALAGLAYLALNGG